MNSLMRDWLEITRYFTRFANTIDGFSSIDEILEFIQEKDLIHDQSGESYIYLVGGAYKFARDEGKVDPISAVDLMMRKRRDYGNLSITMTGRTGIVVRIIDKLARIKNLSESIHHTNFESLSDSYVDLHNYCIIGIECAE